MAHLKTVNKAIQEKYKMKLVKGKGYFYFVGTTELFKNLLCGLESTSVYTAKISDLSLEQWMSEADAIYSQIEEEIPPTMPTVTYFWEAKDGAGNRYTRTRDFCTDAEALEWADSFRDGYKDFKVWKKIG